MNKVILLGRLTRDPEIRYSAGDNSTCVARYTLAVDRRFSKGNDSDGNNADFIPCVAFGKSGDVLLAISTSGTSANVVKAAQASRQAGMKVIALTSKKGQTLSALSDVSIMAPDAPHSDRIQEIHIKVIHILIEAIEALLSE